MLARRLTHKRRANQRINPRVEAVDSSRIAILSFQPSVHWMFSEGKPVALSANECTQVEIILRSSIDAYNVERAKIFEETSQKYPDLQLQKYLFVIELERYYR